MKENCSKKTSEIVSLEINYFLIKIVNLLLLFAVLTRGRRVHYGNVVVQQPLSASSVISAACVSVAVVHITPHDSVSVVRTTFKVCGKMQTLTLSQHKTPELIITNFERRDYVVDAYHQKIGLNLPRGFCSPYR